MTNLNSVKKKIFKQDWKFIVNHPSKLLAEFFNGMFIQFDEEY